MTPHDTWQTIAAERGALADDLATLTPEQWDTPSLCAGWTVRDVVAHMSGTAQTTPVGFFVDVARNGGFQKFLDAKVAENRGADPAETLATFRSLQHSTNHPPGPLTSWLGEAIVHAEDIRRPLGIRHEYPTEALRELADFYTRSNLVIGGRKRVAGLRMRATDADWSHGSGAPLDGPLLALVMATTGRTAHLDDLSGHGVEVLRRR